MNFDLLDIEIELMLDELEDDLDDRFGSNATVSKNAEDLAALALGARKRRDGPAWVKYASEVMKLVDDVIRPFVEMGVLATAESYDPDLLIPELIRSPKILEVVRLVNMDGGPGRDNLLTRNYWRNLEGSDGYDVPDPFKEDVVVLGGPGGPIAFGALGPIGSKKLIEDTWEVAITADSGSASIRNVETGRMFIIHAGDRLGHAEVSDITAGGVEIAADDGSLYVVGAGARAGTPRATRSRYDGDPKEIIPFDEWRKPDGVSGDHWQNTMDRYKCALSYDMSTIGTPRGIGATGQQVLEKSMSRGVYRVAAKRAEMEALGKHIMDHDGISPYTDPRFVAAKTAYISEQVAHGMLSDRYVAGRSPQEISIDECEDEHGSSLEEVSWDFENINMRNQSRCSWDFDKKYTDAPWDEIISAAKAGKLSRPRANFGSTAVSSILSHRYSCPR